MTSPVHNTPGRARGNGAVFIAHSTCRSAAQFAHETYRVHLAHQMPSMIVPLRSAAVSRPEHCPSLVLVIDVVDVAGPRSDPGPELDLALGVVRDYRSHRPMGLGHVEGGLIQNFQAGVVQTVLAGRLSEHPLGRQLHRYTCRRHVLGEAAPTDLLALWTPHPVATPRTLNTENDLGRAEIRLSWQGLVEWGVSEPRQVPLLHERLEGYRAHLRNDVRKPSLYRPVHDRDRSRLDWLLDEPSFQPPGSIKSNWMSEGARVVREAIHDLQVIVPELRNPARTKGAQARFRHFHLNLRQVRLYMQIAPDEKFWLP